MSCAATLLSRISRLFLAYDCPFLPAGRVRRRLTSTATPRSLRQDIASEPQHPPHRRGLRSHLKYIVNSRDPRSRQQPDHGR